jgi:hypothetical protein
MTASRTTMRACDAWSDREELRATAQNRADPAACAVVASIRDDDRCRRRLAAAVSARSTLRQSEWPAIRHHELISCRRRPAA